MGGKGLPTCRHCGCRFRADRYNHHHQKWCSAPGCRRARDRERRRRHYLNRLAHNPQFRESERQRCREAMRRCRLRRATEGSGLVTAILALPPAGELLAGLVSHLADSTDPHVIVEVMNRYAQRGRLLANSAPIRGSP
jgi:hypothetical protein